MQLLRGLRLNCFLAALAPSLIACFFLVYQQRGQQEHILETYSTEAQHSLQAYASLLSDPEQRQSISNTIAHADDRWSYLAIVKLDKIDDEFTILIEPVHGMNNSLEIDNPQPSLVKSLVEAQQWHLSSVKMAVACPLQFKGQDVGVLYGEISVPNAENAGTIIIIVSSALIIGLMIAWYLSQRIYKPIEYLCNESEAALSGQGTGAHLVSSAETARVASSINDLLSRYQAQNMLDSSIDSEGHSNSKDE